MLRYEKILKVLMSSRNSKQIYTQIQTVVFISYDGIKSTVSDLTQLSLLLVTARMQQQLKYPCNLIFTWEYLEDILAI